MALPNPHRAPAAWYTVILGGRRIKAVLRKVNGNKIEDEWTPQKATGTSNATNVFKGTTSPGPFELEFESVSAEDFDDLSECYEQMAPKPGGGVGVPGAKPGDAFAGAAQKKDASANGSPIPASKTTPTDKDGFPKSSGKTIGPAPPTLTIDNAYFNHLYKVTAVSRGSWEGPTITATNSYTVKIKLIAQKPSVPAGVGLPAAKGDAFSGGVVTQKDGAAAPATPTAKADKMAATAGAGT